MELLHKKHGVLVPGKKKYYRLGNRYVQMWADKNGIERELDGTEMEMPKMGKNPELMKKIDDNVARGFGRR